MPKIVQTKLYTYDELSDDAKEKAREWWIEGSDDDWQFEQEWVYDDVKTVAALLGIDIDKIWYTGFWSQGDGACFDGTYSYKKGWRKALLDHLGDIDEKTIAKFRTQEWTDKMIADYIKERKRLLAIGQDLQDIQKKYFYQIHSRTKHSGHYYHEYCTTITNFIEEEDGWGGYEKALILADDEAMDEALRSFMRYIYTRLEETYDWMCEEEQVAEAINANEYTFTKYGKRADVGEIEDDDDEDEDEET